MRRIHVLNHFISDIFSVCAPNIFNSKYGFRLHITRLMSSFWFLVFGFFFFSFRFVYLFSHYCNHYCYRWKKSCGIARCLHLMPRSTDRCVRSTHQLHFKLIPNNFRLILHHQIALKWMSCIKIHSKTGIQSFSECTCCRVRLHCCRFRGKQLSDGAFRQWMMLRMTKKEHSTSFGCKQSQSFVYTSSGSSR